MAGAKDTEYLFVYGTLLRDVNHAKSTLLEKYGTKRGRMIFRGKLYDVGSYPAAIPSNNRADKVIGELYELLQPTPLIEKLDTYEGYEPENIEASHYIRKKVTVHNVAGKNPTTAWIYLFNKSVDNLKQIAGGDYLEYLRSKKSQLSS